jgi:hypothetical protein
MYFWTFLLRTPTLHHTSDLVARSQLLTFADVLIYLIEPPPGFEALAMAMTE